MSELAELLSKDNRKIEDLAWFKHHRQPDEEELVFNGLITPPLEVELFDTTPPRLEEPGPGPEKAKNPRSRAGTWDHWRPPAELPEMLLILGVGLVGWTPAIEQRPMNGPCLVCGSRKLKGREFCIACCRSGLDPRLPVAVPLPPEPRRKYSPDPTGLAGGVGKAG
jgi:hypothetical protein